MIERFARYTLVSRCKAVIFTPSNHAAFRPVKLLSNCRRSPGPCDPGVGRTCHAGDDRTHTRGSVSSARTRTLRARTRRRIARAHAHVSRAHVRAHGDTWAPVVPAPASRLTGSCGTWATARTGLSPARTRRYVSSAHARARLHLPVCNLCVTRPIPVDKAVDNLGRRGGCPHAHARGGASSVCKGADWELM